MKAAKKILSTIAVSSLIATLSACGDVATVADVPDNFTGSYSGTIAGFPATMSIAQSTTTTPASPEEPAVTKESFTGGISINTNSGFSGTATSEDPACIYNINFTQGSSVANTVSLSGEGIVVSLIRSGSALTGSATFTGSAITVEDDRGTETNTDDNPIECPTPNGTASFSR